MSAGADEQVIISNSNNRYNARYRCLPVPARKNLLFAGDLTREMLLNIEKRSPGAV